MERGKAYLAVDDCTHALVMFRRALLASPRDPEAHYLAGLAHLGLGDYGSALVRISSAVEMKPDFRDARMKLAELYASSRDARFIEEARLIANSLATGPNSQDAPVLNLLGLVEYQLGQRESAVRRLQKAIAQSPGYVRSYINLASFELAGNRCAAAIQVLSQARRVSPESAMVALALGRAYRISGDTVRAERELRAALKLEPGNAEALQSVAGLLDETGRRSQAAETYQELGKLPNRNYRFAYGEYLQKTARPKDAELEFRKIYARDPADRKARMHLISALRDQNNVQAVKSIVTATLGRNPNDVDALLERGRLRLAEGQVDDAVNDIRRVTAAWPDSVEAHCLLAQAFSMKGAFKLRREELAEALRLNPGLLVVRLQLADSFISDKNADAALETLRQAPAGQQDVLPVTIYRNSALLSDGDLPELAKVLPGQIARYNHPDLLLQDASVKLRMGHFSAARESIGRALERGADRRHGLELLAETYAQQGKPEEGLAAISSTAANYPNDAGVQFLFGLQLTRANRFEEARRAFTASSKDRAYSERAGLGLAAVQLKANQPAEARRLATEVQRRNPNSLAAVLVRGNAEAVAGDKNSAMASYRQVLEREPDNFEALNNLAYLLGEDEAKREEALAYARRAMQIQPANPSVNDTLGWLLYRQGLRQSALHYLQTAVSGDGSARHQYHLAIAYAGAGEHRLAAHVFEQAFRQDPRLDEEKLARSVLTKQEGLIK